VAAVPIVSLLGLQLATLMLVFNLLTEGNIARAIAGERIGTLVTT
jgi:isopentenyl phosphate kinase